MPTSEVYIYAWAGTCFNDNYIPWSAREKESLGQLTLDNNIINDIQLSTDAFSDVDDELMTAAAIADKIESYGYLDAETDDQTAVEVSTNVGSFGAILSASEDTVQKALDVLDDLSFYTQAEVNALTWAADDIVSGTLADARIASSSITQHEGDIDHDQLTNFAAGEHFTQASITTVGTIGTGTWQGTAIADTYVANDITCSNYLPLVGGTLTGDLTATGEITSANPKFSAYKSSSQNINSASWTKVTWESENYDIGGGYSTSTDRFTPPTTGYYHFDVGLRIDSRSWSAGNSFQVRLLKNNATAVGFFHYEAQQYTSSQIKHTSGGFDVYLTTSDYVQVYCYTNGASTINASSAWTFWTGHKL